MPRLPEKLKPGRPSTKLLLERDGQDKRQQAADFNRRHAEKELCGQTPGNEVWVKDIQCSAKVLSQAQRPRSYIVD